MTIVCGTIGICIDTLAVSFVLNPIARIYIAVVVVHGTLTLLVIAEPQSFVPVVVRKVICTYAMLLILKPLTIVFFAIILGTTLFLELLKAWGAAKLKKFPSIL